MSLPYEQLSSNLEARIDNILNMDWLQAQQSPSLFTFGSSNPFPSGSISSQPITTGQSIPSFPSVQPLQSATSPVYPIIFGSTHPISSMEQSGPKFSMAVVVLCVLIGILIVLVGFIVHNLITQHDPAEDAEDQHFNVALKKQ